MRVSAQVLDEEKGTIEVQVEDGFERVSRVKLNGAKLLDCEDVKDICSSLNTLALEMRGNWEPHATESSAEAVFTPENSLTSGVYRFPELRNRLQDRITFVENWLVEAKELLKRSKSCRFYT